MTEQNTQPTAPEGNFDVREALTKRLADEIEYRVRTAVALAKGGHSIAAQVTDGRASVPVILKQFEVRPRGTVTDALYCAHCQNDDHATYACEASEPEPCSEECGWCGENMPTRPADDVREAADEEHDFTPSTDDVRKARFQALREAVFPWSTEESTEACNLIRELLDEVSQHGTVPAKQISDAEVDAAGRHLGMGDGMEHWIDRDSVRAALEAAWEVRSDV